MSEPISMDREYKLRNGYEVKLFTVEGRSNQPIAGEYCCPGGRWEHANWTARGRYMQDDTESCLDLVEVPRKHTLEFWLNVNRDDDGNAFLGERHSTREMADSLASKRRIACKHLTFEVTEGEGLGEGAK